MTSNGQTSEVATELRRVHELVSMVASALAAVEQELQRMRQELAELKGRS